MEGSASGRTPRLLSEEEMRKLEKEEVMNDFKRKKLEAEAKKNWDKFYLRNKDNFFKDRHWSRQDISSLCSHIDLQDNLIYLEAGCGVGNMLFPLAEYFPHWHFLGFDFSSNAIRMLEERAKSLEVAVDAKVFDLTDPEEGPSGINESDWPQADLATLVFVLSAIHPDKHAVAVRNLNRFVKIGGTVIVRDYGVNDHAMIRFGRGSKLSERFYARQDGTRAFYFLLEELEALFLAEGYRIVQSEYLFRKTVNHQKGLSVDRVFVQSVFIKTQ